MESTPQIDLAELFGRKPLENVDLAMALDIPDPNEAGKAKQLFNQGVSLLHELYFDLVASPNKVRIKKKSTAFKEGDEAVVTAESQKRKKKREALLDESLVAKEERFQSMPARAEEEEAAKTQAIHEITERRKGLVRAMEILYASQNFQEELPEIIKQAIEAKRAEAKAVDATKDITKEEIDKITEEITAKYKSSRGYHFLGEDGEPLTSDAEVGQVSEALETIYEELKLAGESNTVLGGTISEEDQKEAKRIQEALSFDPDKKVLRVRSVEQTNAEVIQQAALNFLEKRIRIKGFEGVLTRNEAGEITGFDDKKLSELLKGQDIDGSISQISILLVAFQNNADNPNLRIRQNIISLLYGTLEQVDRASLAKVQEPKVYGLRLQAITKEILTNWLEPAGYRFSSIPNWNNLLKNLCLGLFCEGKLEIQDQRHVLNKSARAVFDEMRKSGATNLDEDMVIALAQRTGTASGMLTQILGIESDLFTDQKLLSEYAGKVIGIFKEQKPDLSDHETKAYKQVIDYQFGTDALEKIAKKNGLSGKLGMIAILLMIFAPALQGLASDLTEEKQQ